MKNLKVSTSFVVVFAFAISVFFLIRCFSNPIILNNIRSVEIAGQNIKVDLALTETEQTQGLSGRQNLAQNEGMLFIFNKPGKYLFWMKDMNFPIDIIWLAPFSDKSNSKAKVVYIKKNARPELFPETYGPGANDEKAEYVLEVSAGFAEKNNLKIGDSVEFVY